MFSLKKKPPQPSLQEQPTMEPLNQEPEIQSSTGSPAEPPSHFDTLIGVETEQAPPIMTQEEFRIAFVNGFGLAHTLTELQSLNIDGEKQPRAFACADAIYDTAVEVPSMRFMIQPGSKWWSRVFAIGLFTLPMAKSVAIELRERNIAKQKAREDVMPPPPAAGAVYEHGAME